MFAKKTVVGDGLESWPVLEKGDIDRIAGTRLYRRVRHYLGGPSEFKVRYVGGPTTVEVRIGGYWSHASTRRVLLLHDDKDQTIRVLSCSCKQGYERDLPRLHLNSAATNIH